MSVDSRILTMKFDNAQFIQGVSSTLGALDKLKSGMNFQTIGSGAVKGLGMVSGALQKLGFDNTFTRMADKFTGFASKFLPFGKSNPVAGATAGVSELQRATNGFQMGGMEASVGGVSKSFLALSTVAITALSNITNKAINAGSQLVKSLTVDPVMGGLQEYETNLNSVQTILANTKVSGAGLKEVNAALDELNHYSDKTIYNFSEMARNIGTFTAAGVDLDTATSSIKGIANLAALSGSNSQQASTAMYQLSQEIAAGRVSLMGWNSVVNAGMGGSTFQRALVQTGQKMGALDGAVVKFQGKMKNASIDGKSFRDSIMAKPGEQSWLTSEVLTKTLEQFTGDMSDAELAAQGFSKAQIKAIQAQAKTAVDAATKVKTLSGVIDTAKEVAGSGWAKTWQTVFGDFKEARTLFTDVSNTVNGFIGSSADARNKVLGDWKEMGGRTVIIEAIGDAFNAVVSVLSSVKDAFRDVFPAKTGEDLYNLTKRFAEFTANLKPSAETLENLKRTFRGVFSIFSIVGQVIGGVVSMIGRLIGAVSDGSGGFLAFTGGVGDFLFALDQAMKKGGIVKGFFEGLGDILAVPLTILRKLAAAFGGLFGGVEEGGGQKLGSAIKDINDKLDPLAAMGEKVRQIFAAIGGFISSVGASLVEALSVIGSAIVKSFSSATFDQVLDTINTGLFAGLVVLLKNFAKNGINADLTGGLFEGVTETLGEVTNTLKSMQAQVKADVILKIAIALGVLTAAVFVLSTIDPKKMATALGGMAVGFAGLQIAMLNLSRVMTLVGTAKIPVIAAALIMLASSILILAVALKLMSTISVGDMIKSLGGLVVMLKVMTKAVESLSKNRGPMLRSAAALTILSVSLNLMAIALKIMASLSWEEMARGLIGVAGSLILLTTAMRFMPKNTQVQSYAMLILAASLGVLAIALKLMATISYNDLFKGLLATATALTIISVAINSMPKTMMLQASALLVVSAALVVLSGALKVMGSMSIGSIFKSMVAIAGSLYLLSGALRAMMFGLPGAAALAVAAAALWVLAPVLVALGAMSWGAIVKGLVSLAGVFVILGVAGYVLAPVVPVIVSLGLAVLAMGVGMASAGAGILMVASAFGVFVGALVLGGAAVGRFVGNIVRQIPKAMVAFARGIIGMAKVIASSGPAMIKAFSAILSSFLRTVIKNVPLMGRAFLTMLNTALRVIVNMGPKIFNAGLRLILGFLQAINRNIGKIIPIAASIIVKFVNGIANNIGRIIQAGVNLIIKFVNGVASAIDRNSGRMGEAGGRLAVAIIRGMANGLWNGASTVANAAIDAAKSALNAAKGVLGIHSPSRAFAEVGMYSAMGLADGLKTHTKRVDRAATDVGKSALTAMKATMSGMSAVAGGDLTLNPTISPVLDLSKVRKEAVKMGGILATDKIAPSTALRSARSISAETAAAREAMSAQAPEQVVKEVKFEQNNYSPKALSPTEIYRNTRNQLALTKEALKA